MLTDDEAMIIELRNTVRSRNSLRSKHLAQLEESKANLTEIKSRATQKLLNRNNSVDQEFPNNEDESRKTSFSTSSSITKKSKIIWNYCQNLDFDRSHSAKRDAASSARMRAAENVLNRVSSSKTQKSM